jgi:hypothetical protein
LTETYNGFHYEVLGTRIIKNGIWIVKFKVRTKKMRFWAQCAKTGLVGFPNQLGRFLFKYPDNLEPGPQKQARLVLDPAMLVFLVSRHLLESK